MTVNFEEPSYFVNEYSSSTVKLVYSMCLKTKTNTVARRDNTDRYGSTPPGRKPGVAVFGHDPLHEKLGSVTPVAPTKKGTVEP